jgi:tetratricopeptide (TPR) repeat protein
MPVQRFFEEQIDSLRAFLLDPSQTMRCILTDPELKPLVSKILMRLDNDDQDPHIYLSSETPFQEPAQFFASWLAEVQREYQRCQGELESAGVRVNVSREELGKLSPAQRFVRFVCVLADAMPESVGSLVLILDPTEVNDPQGYRRAMTFLADNTVSPWVKYVILDRRQQPVLKHMELKSDRSQVQIFHFSAEKIEKDLRASLADKAGCSLEEKRQWMALLAGFVFHHKDYAGAQKLQEECLALAEAAGDAGEQAMVSYNLGNTHFHKGDFQAAEACYGSAIEVALGNELDNFLPLALTNLGLTLHRQKKASEAFHSLEIARTAWQAQGYPASEAYALDCQAELCQADKKNEEAERCWRGALALYDGMNSEGMQEFGESGRANIVRKLEQHFQATKQHRKLDELKRGGGIPGHA